MDCDRNICYAQEYNGGCETCPCNEDSIAFEPDKEIEEVNMKETNMEHYRERLEKVLKSGKHFGLDRTIGGAPAACDDVGCGDCEFTTICTGLDDRCEIERIKWLMSEYKPEPVLTKREKAFIEFAETGWLVRTKDLNVIWHKDKPHKEINKLYQEIWVSNKMKFPLYLDGCRGMFPFIRCADEEPWSVEELRKLKEVK